MMRFYRISSVLLAAGILTAVMPLTAAAGTPEHGLSKRVYGPGEDNLSAGDPYARYQWGLRNDGELQ